MRRCVIVGVFAVAALPLAAAEAQRRPWRGERAQDYLGQQPFGHTGGGLVVGVPAGEFENYVTAGIGLGGFFLLRLDQRGTFGLRMDGAFLIYGHETRRRPLSPTVPLVTVDVTTSNNIVNLAIGPQFTRPQGAVRPYAGAAVGLSYFSTVSSVRGTLSSEPFASSTNFDDFTFSWRSGGGLLIFVSRGRAPVAIDLSAHYLRNGRVTYLTEGSIVELSGGGVEYQPVESETNLWLVQLGVSVGLRPRRE